MDEIEEPLVADEARLREAYESVLPEANALPAALERTVNCHLPSAVTTALATVGKIRALRERAARLPEFDISTFDRLERYALAMFQAHAIALTAITPPSSLPELIERGQAMRREVLDDIKPLSNRKLLDPTRLSKLSGGTGHRELTLDLAIIAQVLRKAWPSIAQLTPLTEADLDELERVSEMLLIGLAHKQGDPQVVEEAEKTERRIFTLFANAYRQVERAIDYLCWDQNPDLIAPTIYTGSGKRPVRKNQAGDKGPTTAPAGPPEAAAQQPAPPQTGINVPQVGDPNSNPFEN